MPKISEKGRLMPASPIRKLVPFADAAKKNGKHIYHLNIGQPDILTPDIALRAVKNINRNVIEYSPSAGFESYRIKLLNYYKKAGIDLTLENILVTTGGSEAILFGMFSCLDPGDEVIIPEPFYANYNGFAIAGSVVVKPVTSKIENAFALPPISDFEQLIGPKTRAIMICNPNNPTGYLYSEAELEQLRMLVLKHDLFLFADEVYREFVYDRHQHHSVLNLKGLEQHVVLMDSVSKRYSACGLRIGALISRNAEVMQTAMKFAQARLSPPTLGQIAAEAALDVDDTYFRGVHQEYDSRRNLLVERLQAMDYVLCPKPRGAFYCIARLPVDNSDRFCQWLLEDFNYKGSSVMLAPATGFYASPDAGQDEVRIAYVLKKNDLNAAMDCLEEALQVYPGRTLN